MYCISLRPGTSTDLNAKVFSTAHVSVRKMEEGGSDVLGITENVRSEYAYGNIQVAQTYSM